jgi:DNA-binding CsgD family transcriptional regulator
MKDRATTPEAKAKAAKVLAWAAQGVSTADIAERLGTKPTYIRQLKLRAKNGYFDDNGRSDG